MNASLPPNIFALINEMEAQHITLSLRDNGILPFYPEVELSVKYHPIVKALMSELVYALTLRQIYRNQQRQDGVRSH